MPHPRLPALASAVVLGAAALAAVAPAQAVSPDVVIAGVYGGGGNKRTSAASCGPLTTPAPASTASAASARASA